MKTTIRRFHEILPILNKVPSNGVGSKLLYAVNKIGVQFKKATQALSDDLNEKVADYNNSLAMVDEKGAIIYENAGLPNQSYKYTREDAKKIADNAKKLNEIYLNAEVEIDGYFIDDIDDAVKEANRFFNLFDKEELIGILYNPETKRNMEEYIITEDYFDENQSVLEGSDFPVGTICTQDEDGTLHLVESHKGAQTQGDPNVPPPKSPPILP